MEGRKEWKSLKTDTVNQLMEINAIRDTLNIDTLFYEVVDTNYLHLNGIYLGDTLKMVLKEKKREDFLLVNRGYHWVNEYPFNR